MSRLTIGARCFRAMAIACSGIGVALVVASLASTAYAMQAAPEFDPASATSALTLLTGGLLMIAGRMRRR